MVVEAVELIVRPVEPVVLEVEEEPMVLLVLQVLLDLAVIVLPEECLLLEQLLLEAVVLERLVLPLVIPPTQEVLGVVVVKVIF